jgi:glutathione S-transferase
MLKLYFSTGACSLSPHITLRESGLPFELVQVDLRAKQLKSGGGDYRTINPKGYVPALELDDGQVLTEGAVIVQYIADQKPELRLAPKVGTFERLRLQEWLNFIATELHKGMSPLYNPKANDEFKASLRERLGGRFGHLAQHLESRAYIMGESFTVADPYAFYCLRGWKKFGQAELAPSLQAYFDRVAARPSVKTALEVEAKAG